MTYVKRAPKGESNSVFRPTRKTYSENLKAAFPPICRQGRFCVDLVPRVTFYGRRAPIERAREPAEGLGAAWGKISAQTCP